MLTDEHYKEAMLKADPQTLDLLANGLVEAEKAKQLLRSHGYGVTGMGILNTVREVLEVESE